MSYATVELSSRTEREVQERRELFPGNFLSGSRVRVEVIGAGTQTSANNAVVHLYASDDDRGAAEAKLQHGFHEIVRTIEEGHTRFFFEDVGVRGSNGITSANGVFDRAAGIARLAAGLVVTDYALMLDSDLPGVLGVTYAVRAARLEFATLNNFGVVQDPYRYSGHSYSQQGWSGGYPPLYASGDSRVAVSTGGAGSGDTRQRYSLPGPQRVWVNYSGGRLLRFGPSQMVRGNVLRLQRITLNSEVDPERTVYRTVDAGGDHFEREVYRSRGVIERVSGEWAGQGLNQDDADGLWTLTGHGWGGEFRLRSFTRPPFGRPEVVLEREIALRV